MPRWTDRMPPLSVPFILGWEEWIALPELGLPAIKAKVDTGARTSALHADFVEPFGPARARKVRFGVHPVPRRDDLRIECTARLVDRREIRSSNGEREQRYVIETPIRIGGREWPIEVTLANRNMMTYRMLLGRQAIARGVLVDPSSSFLQPKLRYKVYEPARR
jgi:ribosomal protein S6--L-glutamate ligase